MVTFSSDTDVLNYALTLEQFEAALYKVLIGTNILSGAEQGYLTTFGAQEQQHVDALTAAIKQLGGTPVAMPAAYNLAAAGPITNRGQLLAVIQTVEDLGAAAYLGAAGFIQNRDLLTAAVTIHAVEAEHASIFRDLLGMAPAPDAVAKGMTPDEVIAKVTPFLQAPAPGAGTGSSGPVGSGTGSSTPGSAGTTPTTSTANPGPERAHFIHRLGDG
jgi:Ferritin-like domain